MAIECQDFDFAFITAADLSASQYCAVAFDNTGKINLPGAGANIVGVLQNKPKSGAAGEVRVQGITKMYTAGSITAGDPVKVDTAGKAVTASTTNKAIGWSLFTQAAGDLCSILLKDFTVV